MGLKSGTQARECVEGSSIRLNLLYDRSSKGSWRWRTVCDSRGLQNRAASRGNLALSPSMSSLLHAAYPCCGVQADERVREHVDSSSSACCDIPNVLTIIHGPHTAASFLFALIKLSFLGSSAANHFVRTLARLRPLTECSLITNVRRVRFIFDGVKAAALLTLSSYHYYVTINTYIETHFRIRSESSFDIIRNIALYSKNVTFVIWPFKLFIQ